MSVTEESTSQEPAWRRVLASPRAPLVALGILFLAGIAVRVWTLYLYRPAFLGYADTQAYILAADGDLWLNLFRPAGYSTFLRGAHVLSDHLTYTIVIQHVLGLATAALAYLTIARLGVSRWLGLLPAGVILLDSVQINMEHAVMSEALFGVVFAGGAYAAVRTLDDRPLAWAALAGLLLGLSMTVRTTGLFTVPVLCIWLLLSAPARRAGLRNAALAGAVALVVAAAYVGLQRHETGVTSLSRADGYIQYARIAQFADCDRFDPPDETDVVCEETPPDERRYGQLFYAFNEASPARRLKDPPWEASGRLGDFARAAIIHQPLDYAEAVAKDFVRYVVRGAYVRVGEESSPRGLLNYLHNPIQEPKAQAAAEHYYATRGFLRRNLSGLERYTEIVHVDGPFLGVLLALAIAAPFVTRGRARTGALLLLPLALVMLIIPVMSVHYEPRYGLPAYGPLAAAAALALGALPRWVRRIRRARAT